MNSRAPDCRKRSASNGAVRRCAFAGALGALGASLATSLLGCKGPLENGPIRIDRERLRTAEEIELGPLSTTPPESIPEATKRVLRDVVDPKPPLATTDLELAAVRASALANNLELQTQLYNPTIAETLVTEEEARFESTFFASARRAVGDQPVPSLLDASQSTIYNYDVGVRVPLRTGGTAVVDLPFNDVETNNVFSTLNPSYQTALGFSISQPLLRNAGIRTNTTGIRVAALQSQIVDAQTKLSAIRILAAADKGYWALYAARRVLEVQQQRYELSLEQLERARRLVAAGSVAEVEVIRAEAGVAESLTGIIVAETDLKFRRRDLKRIMNREDLPVGGPTDIVPTTEPNPVGLNLDGEELAARAIANRMEMLELELQLAIDSNNLDFERNQALPLFVVDFNYSRNGLGADYGASFQQLVEQRYEDWSVGANLEIPLGNEAAKSRVARAILTRVQRLGTRDQRRQAIRQEVFDGLDQLQQNWQRILAARQQSILAGRTYEAEKRQFELGVRTSTDVLDAAARLADAQSQEVRALADYQIAQVDIAFATGTLLGSGRVEWAPRTAEVR